MPGIVEGKYGKDRVPVLDARFKINEGSVKYEGMPYSLDKLDVDLEGVVNLQKEQPSFLKLNRFLREGDRCGCGFKWPGGSITF